MDVLLITVVLFALVFDFTNGFHDTANAIATSVSTKAVSPRVAVIAAAILNFLGALVSLKVAATIAKGIIIPGSITLHVVLAGLVAAIVWNVFTWRIGMPTSSSHALIGGMAGSAVVASGWKVLKWNGLTAKVLVPSLVSIALALLGAGIIILLLTRLTRRLEAQKRNRVFRRLQLVSGSFVAFTHGTNDAQKTMGVIALALIAGQPAAHFSVPMWVILSCATAMALGSYFGGWRIVDTLGRKLVQLEPQQGFAAETATAAILGTTAMLGFPVSTTHTIAGAITGSGVASNKENIRWKVARDILIAWVVTIPAVALVGGGMDAIIRLPGGTAVVVGLAVAVPLATLVTRSWTWESTAQMRARLNFLQPSRKPSHPTNLD